MFIQLVINDFKKRVCNQRGGFDLLQTLGLKAKRPNIEAYKGPRPVTRITDTALGKKYKQTLEGRLAGRGVGFSEQKLSSATSPYAASRRAGLREQTIPLISAEASARGLGRSTIPVNRIALASGAAERDIGGRISELRLSNEQQKRQEISDALGKFGTLAGADVAQSNLAAQTEQGIFNQQRGLDINAQEKAAASDKAYTDMLIQLGATAIGGAVGGPAGAMMGSQIAKSITSSGEANQTISSIDSILNTRNKAQVNLGGTNPPGYKHLRRPGAPGGIQGAYDYIGGF